MGLFTQAQGYLGTLFLEDRTKANRYLTIDRWECEKAYQEFRQKFSREYDELDELCEGFTVRETPIGSFYE